MLTCNTALELEEDSLIGMRSLEVFNSIFDITNGNNKYNIYNTGYEDEVFYLIRCILSHEYEKDS